VRRTAIGMAALALLVELAAAILFIVAQPQWAKSVMRTEYVWLFKTANWLTGQDLPTPERFR
jgi:hypothetical protein